MSSYIDREALKHEVNKSDLYGTDEWCKFLDIVADTPSADVVKVVRCKDCKHHEELLNNNDGKVLCWVNDIDVVVDRNGYCNYGERKEQEHDSSKSV